MYKLSSIKEMAEFLTARKKWWLVPIIIFLLLFGAIVTITQTSAVSPLIYAIF